ncbi:hypothetical protein CAPTEDRAFT_196286 [Capitella teleta]|uniref:Uncharacterized protein n=1 Tax=Capitella teleta TaxID=283909 RepID=R7T4D8_CAPTE|nr:hypothetical protein CAPTEDRAFT_196286 [Capitella teleta]|eukprot:ELT87862.1 hypothetical protein CAPTEDRAFT_196286 [Capitella teleta]
MVVTVSMAIRVITVIMVIMVIRDILVIRVIVVTMVIMVIRDILVIRVIVVTMVIIAIRVITVINVIMVFTRWNEVNLITISSVYISLRTRVRKQSLVAVFGSTGPTCNNRGLMSEVENKIAPRGPVIRRKYNRRSKGADTAGTGTLGVVRFG